MSDVERAKYKTKRRFVLYFRAEELIEGLLPSQRAAGMHDLPAAHAQQHRQGLPGLVLEHYPILHGRTAQLSGVA